MILPVYPEIAALKAMHALLDYLSEVGSIGAKATFVLNNMFARDILKLRDVESALGSKVAVELPYDPFLYLKAVNEGDPDRHRGAEVDGRGAAHQAEPERLRRGRLQRPGRRQRAPVGPLRASPPGLTAIPGRGAGGPQVLRWTFPERAPWGRPDSRAEAGARAMVRTFGTGRTWVCGRHAPPAAGAAADIADA